MNLRGAYSGCFDEEEADGHSESWKWDDSRTIEIAEMDHNLWQGSGRLSDMDSSLSNYIMCKKWLGANLGMSRVRKLFNFFRRNRNV